ELLHAPLVDEAVAAKHLLAVNSGSCEPRGYHRSAQSMASELITSRRLYHPTFEHHTALGDLACGSGECLSASSNQWRKSTASHLCLPGAWS
ncbi:MAG: hypothetical protein ACKO66_09590, partial [Flavobacteriales bacterium]